MDTQKFELEKRIKEQHVLKAELESLKPSKQVYAQQANSYVFFKSDIKTCLSDCKKSLIQLEKQQKKN